MRQPLISSEVTFELIRELYDTERGSIIKKIDFLVDNGALIRAERKITKRGGQVVTHYLHITIFDGRGKFKTYRETSDGNFKLISDGRYDVA